MSLYSLFNLDSTCDINELKKRYKKLSLIYHPDKNDDDEIFIQLKRAYDILSNPLLRKYYDLFEEDGVYLIEKLGDECHWFTDKGLELYIKDEIANDFSQYIREVSEFEQSTILTINLDIDNFKKTLSAQEGTTLIDKEQAELMLKDQTFIDLSYNQDINEIEVAVNSDLLTLAIYLLSDNNHNDEIYALYPSMSISLINELYNYNSFTFKFIQQYQLQSATREIQMLSIPNVSYKLNKQHSFDIQVYLVDDILDVNQIQFGYRYKFDSFHDLYVQWFDMKQTDQAIKDDLSEEEEEERR